MKRVNKFTIMLNREYRPGLKKGKAVFIDKDGTLLQSIPYSADPSLISLKPGAFQAMNKIKKGGFLLVVVTNQSGIGKGLFTIRQFFRYISVLNRIFLNRGISIDACYFCPHASQKQSCTCHKPSPGMILKAAREMNIDLKNSWMIGDVLNDIEAGSRAGCRTILINNGNEREWAEGKYRIPYLAADSLLEAAGQVIAHSGTGIYYGKVLSESY